MEEPRTTLLWMKFLSGSVKIATFVSTKSLIWNNETNL